MCEGAPSTTFVTMRCQMAQSKGIKEGVRGGNVIAWRCARAFACTPLPLVLPFLPPSSTPSGVDFFLFRVAGVEYRILLFV